MDAEAVFEEFKDSRAYKDFEKCGFKRVRQTPFWSAYKKRGIFVYDVHLYGIIKCNIRCPKTGEIECFHFWANQPSKD